jgi:hypothetical protein
MGAKIGFMKAWENKAGFDFIMLPLKINLSYLLLYRAKANKLFKLLPLNNSIMKKEEKKIHFASKAENNRRREQEFLALSPAERFQSFLRSFDSDLFSQFVDPKELGENKGNFCIYKDEI